MPLGTWPGLLRVRTYGCSQVIGAKPCRYCTDTSLQAAAHSRAVRARRAAREWESRPRPETESESLQSPADGVNAEVRGTIGQGKGSCCLGGIRSCSCRCVPFLNRVAPKFCTRLPCPPWRWGRRRPIVPAGARCACNHGQRASTPILGRSVSVSSTWGSRVLPGPRIGVLRPGVPEDVPAPLQADAALRALPALAREALSLGNETATSTSSC